MHASSDPDHMADLIERMNRGDSSAGRDLFTLIYPRLAWLAASILEGFPGVHRRHSVEDVLSLAWIDLETALRKVKPDNAAAYFRLAFHKCRMVLLDLAKEERRRLDHIPINGGGHLPGGFDRGMEPTHGSSSDPGRLELWTRFHEAVGELPEPLRSAFEHHFYSDSRLSQAQIGELLGIPERTVSRHIIRAKDEIAQRVVGLRDLLS